MKKLVCLLAFMFLNASYAVAAAAPPVPPHAPDEYFAIALLPSSGSVKDDATIVVNFSKDGLVWNKPDLIHIKGKKANAVQGVDITNHNFGVLQGFVHDFKSKELDRLLGKKLPSGLKMESPLPALSVAKTGPPASVILPNGDQLLACSINGNVTVFKGKHDAPAGFKKLTLPCSTNKAGRPDIAVMRGLVLVAWRLPTKGIVTALYKRNPLGRIKFIRCENPFYPGSHGIHSDPVLAASDEVFYMGLALKKPGESHPRFKIFRGANGTNWKDHATVGSATSFQIKLGLAAKHAGSLFAAMIEKTKSGVKFKSWLYHEVPKTGWKWTDLDNAPWAHVQPAFKEFGLDSGGVRR